MLRMTMAPWIMLALLIPLSGCLESSDATLGTQALEIHGPEDCEGLGQVREFDLYVNETFHYSPHEGRSLTGFAFGLSPEGPFSIPGPEIRVTQCDTIRAMLHDSAFHTIHWHGLSVPWAMDGVPFVTQAMEIGGYMYEFTAWESGTYWYHCHVEAPAHVDAGLFGALIIDPLDPNADPAFDREETLILHEMDSQLFLAFDYAAGREPSADDLSQNPFDAVEGAYRAARQTEDIGGLIVGGATGEHLGSEGPREYYPLGSIRYRPEYDTFMINGKSYPETEPLHMESGETLRMRLINAGQLVHTMHLHGHHFLVTHKDGYLLPSPYWADTLLIGPAERYDLLVHGTNPGIWDLHDHGGGWGYGGHTSNDHAFPGGMNTMLVYDDFEYDGLPTSMHAQAGDYALFAPGHGQGGHAGARGADSTAHSGGANDADPAEGTVLKDTPGSTTEPSGGVDRPHAGVYRR